MECNVILAGVGGQGILTIAQAISLAAIERNWHVKQAEVHGMSQRGGDVQSHLRFADHELHSDLIPFGGADLVLAIEPLEALRYVQYLKKTGWIVASTAPFVNIPNYPTAESILDRISGFPNHVLIDAAELAKAAGNARAVNTIMLGAASELLGQDLSELNAALAKMFGRKGEAVVAVNQRACRIGRTAATTYRKGLEQGLSSPDVLKSIAALTPEQLEGDGAALLSVGEQPPAEQADLTPEAEESIARIIGKLQLENRGQLYEHEVYHLLEVAGAATPPKHRFIAKGETVSAEHLQAFPGDKVVLKLVSEEVVHKTEAGAVLFVSKDADTVNREVADLIARQGDKKVAGVLMVEFVKQSNPGFGGELFVGIRATREFGPIIAAGLGGVDTEYLARQMKPGVAVAKALAADTTAAEFFELFKKTASYDVLAAKARGRTRAVSDSEMTRCFAAFLAIARRFCVGGHAQQLGLRELEVNPFATVRNHLVPLDGRGQAGPIGEAPVARPVAKIRNMLEPKSIAVIGVSAKRVNFGRIILANVRACGFPVDHVYAIKEGIEEIDGVRCVADVSALPETVDLLVIAAASDKMPEMIESVIDSKKVTTAILIPGGLGETEGSGAIEAEIRKVIQDSRERADGGPVFLGPNSMGIRSRPGSYDTFFIPDNKLDPRRNVPPRRVALVSQSGAFIITRMSNVESLDPAVAVSAGNQIDLTMSDLVRNVGQRRDIDCLGVYVEGFNDLDGLEFTRAVREITAAGKTVVFYKAGRTAPGRAATAGHTASVAGDYDVCQAAVSNAGAIVADTFREFEQLIELGTALHGKKVAGSRIAAISNAGFETVGMADSIQGARYQVEMPDLSEKTAQSIGKSLAEAKIDSLVNVRNPLDLTPMAGERVFEACARAMMEDAEIDAVIVGAVPLTPQLATTAAELEKSPGLTTLLPKLLAESSKPLVAVIDAGQPYDAMANAIRAGGVPVFRSADQAVRSLGRYLEYHAPGNTRVRLVKAASSPKEQAAGTSCEVTA